MSVQKNTLVKVSANSAFIFSGLSIGPLFLFFLWCTLLNLYLWSYSMYCLSCLYFYNLALVALFVLKLRSWHNKSLFVNYVLGCDSFITIMGSRLLFLSWSLCVFTCLNLSYFSLWWYNQLRYGEPTLRRAVPLALALISVSNPRLNILDTLSKFSHDADPEVSHNSIFAMGMVGSGKSIYKHYI